MKLSSRQFAWLQWVQESGAKAWPKGNALVNSDGVKTNTGAAISFVNLVAKGALVGRDGYLEITDYGKRLLTP